MALKITRRRLAFLLLSIPAVMLAIVGLAWSAMHLSLAQLDGTMPAPLLRADVSVQRDALGIPTVKAQDLQDASYALGFLHAHERFFQMDLQSAAVAMPLSYLFGPDALEVDKQHSPSSVAIVDQAGLANLNQVRANCPELKHVIAVDCDAAGTLDWRTELAVASDRFEPEA
jgi:acyl-homoserine lactone acylase PvdQ